MEVSSICIQMPLMIYNKIHLAYKFNTYYNLLLSINRLYFSKTL